MPERSLGGSQYFIRFVNDFAPKGLGVYSIKSKNEALEVFALWLTKAENQSNYKVKAIWLNNGGEYTSKAFTKYLSKKGI
mgnify:CR=1 FL=1